MTKSYMFGDLNKKHFVSVDDMALSVFV